MGKIVTYNELKFPLTPFIELIVDKNNLFKFPYNYLIDCEIYYVVSGSSGQGAKFSIRDPYFGEASDFLHKMAQRSLYDKKNLVVGLRWGWTDANGKSYSMPNTWNLELKDMNMSLNIMGATFDIEFLSMGFSTLNYNMQSGWLSGCTLTRKALDILYKIVENYNADIDSNEFYFGHNSYNRKKIEIYPSKEIMQHKVQSLSMTGYNFSNKKLIDVVNDIAKFITYKTQSDKGKEVPYLSVYDKDENTVVISLLQNKNNENSDILDTMYNGKYYYLHPKKTNVLECNLKYNNYYHLIGARNIAANSTNKRTGKLEKIVSVSDLFKQQIQESNQSTINNTFSKVEAPVTMNIAVPMEMSASAPEQNAKLTQNYLDDVTSRIEDNEVTGDITTIGDPNIFNIGHKMSNKKIHFFNETGLQYFKGEYIITGYKHSFAGQRWTTTLFLTTGQTKVLNNG